MGLSPTSDSRTSDVSVGIIQPAFLSVAAVVLRFSTSAALFIYLGLTLFLFLLPRSLPVPPLTCSHFFAHYTTPFLRDFVCHVDGFQYLAGMHIRLARGIIKASPSLCPYLPIFLGNAAGGFPFCFCMPQVFRYFSHDDCSNFLMASADRSSQTTLSGVLPQNSGVRREPACEEENIIMFFSKSNALRCGMILQRDQFKKARPACAQQA